MVGVAPFFDSQCITGLPASRQRTGRVNGDLNKRFAHHRPALQGSWYAFAQTLANISTATELTNVTKDAGPEEVLKRLSYSQVTVIVASEVHSDVKRQEPRSGVYYTLSRQACHARLGEGHQT